VKQKVLRMPYALSESNGRRRKKKEERRKKKEY
jgi:hypothetical protein